jgi:hypothetical protein
LSLSFQISTALLLLLTAAGQARAQVQVQVQVDEDESQREAAARALFQEGLTHADAGRWGQAADRFEQARLLRSSPEISYNLATALVHQDKLVRATELLRPLSADASAPPAVRAAATGRLAELLPRLAHLTIQAPGGSTDSATVLIDQQPLDAARLGVPLPVDPARHRIELRRGASLIETQTVTLAEGQRQTVTLQQGVPSLALFAQPLQTTTNAASTPSTGPSRSHAWAWALVGAMAVGLTTTALLVTRDSPAPPAGNVDTWTLGR